MEVAKRRMYVIEGQISCLTTINVTILRFETRSDLQANSAIIDETIAPVRKPEGPHAANIESTTALLSPTG
jgi:hypothetical protein